MGQFRELRERQPRLIRRSHRLGVGFLELRNALEGTIGDAQSFCWATLSASLSVTRCSRSARRRGTSDFTGHAEKHMLLGVAQLMPSRMWRLLSGC